LAISFTTLEQWTGEVGDRPKVDRNWGFSGPQILMEVGRQMSDQIYKIIPISDLLSYKGSLSVAPPQDPLAKEKKKKKERNFCCKTEYLRPLLRVGGGIKKIKTRERLTLMMSDMSDSLKNQSRFMSTSCSMSCNISISHTLQLQPCDRYIYNVEFEQENS